MSVKTTGAEYKAYYRESDKKWWPEGSYIDDVVLTVNGITVGDDHQDFDPDTLNDSDSVRIDYGTYFSTATDDDPISLETHFKRWRKAQNTDFFSVEVPKEKVEAVKAAIKAAGGKVA